MRWRNVYTPLSLSGNILLWKTLNLLLTFTCCFQVSQGRCGGVILPSVRIPLTTQRPVSTTTTRSNRLLVQQQQTAVRFRAPAVNTPSSTHPIALRPSANTPQRHRAVNHRVLPQPLRKYITITTYS